MTPDHVSALRHWPAALRQAWHSVVPHESVDGPLVRHFRARQIMALLALLPLIATGNVVNTLIIGWYFRAHLPHTWLWAWCLVATVSLVVAYFWWRALIQSGRRPTADPSATSIIAAQVVFFSLLWCAMPVLVFPQADHHGSMLIATVIVVVMAAVFVMHVAGLAVGGVGELRVDVEDPAEVEAAETEHLIERDIGALGAGDGGERVELARPFDPIILAELLVDHEITRGFSEHGVRYVLQKRLLIRAEVDHIDVIQVVG